MKIYEFKECNHKYAENQSEYLTLPCHKADDGMVTTCWQLSFLDRLSILIFGKVWLQILTFNKPLQPLKMLANKPMQDIKS